MRGSARDQLAPSENANPGAVSRRLVQRDSSKVVKLARLAENAVKNFDLQRALELLGQIRDHSLESRCDYLGGP
jgi:hypothetical protein